MPLDFFWTPIFLVKQKNHGLPRFARNDDELMAPPYSRHREARSDPWIAALRSQ